MIIAGPCSFTNISQEQEMFETIKRLKSIGVNFFRTKIYLGGPSPEKFKIGIEKDGIKTLNLLNDILPTGIEVQIPSQLNGLQALQFVWVGARNCQNYGLLNFLAVNFHEINKMILIKRGMGMAIEELYGIHDVCVQNYKFKPMMIDRGIINTFRTDKNRWQPDICGVLRIKNERIDIFSDLIIDCSHMMENKKYSKDIYDIYRQLGVKNFMFECQAHPEFSETDKNQILSIEELDKIIN